MTTKSKVPAQRKRSEIMHDIEGRHFERCLNQVWSNNRRTLIEVMDWPKARRQIILIKNFESRVPTRYSGRGWPDLESCYAYVPLDDETNTWAGLEEALIKLETAERAKASAEITEDAAKLLGI
jgi:hypothetical protein